MRLGRLLTLLVAGALGATPAAASAHGGTDHGERLVDGELVTVAESAPAGASVRGRAGDETWRATGPRPLAIVQILMPGRDTAAYPALREDTLRSAFVTGSLSASRALHEMTDGVVSLTGRTRTDGDVLPTVTVSSSGGCKWQTWASEAKTQLAALGHSLTPYLSSGNVAYVLRGPTGCSWGGLAYMPGTEIWLSNSIARSLIVHELGHNFSLDHASSARCRNHAGTAVVLAAASACTLDEYGDPFDPMGQGNRHYSAPHKRLGGWLPAGAARTVTESGVYDLQGAADPLSPTRMLRVPRPDGRDLTIELRRPFGTFDAFAATDPAVKGVLLRLHDPDGDDRRTQLLDAVPSTGTFGDAALAVGRSVTDPVTGAAVRLDALDTAGARLSVALDGRLDLLDAAPPSSEPTPDAPPPPPPPAATPVPTEPSVVVPPATTVPPDAGPVDEPAADAPDAPVVAPRRWRAPASVTIDGRRRGKASRSSSRALRGRTISARFTTPVRDLRFKSTGCRTRVTVKIAGRWRVLRGRRAGAPVRDVRVRCASGKRARVAIAGLRGR